MAYTVDVKDGHVVVTVEEKSPVLFSPDDKESCRKFLKKNGIRKIENLPDADFCLAAGFPDAPKFLTEALWW